MVLLSPNSQQNDFHSDGLSLHVDRISMEISFLDFKGAQVEISKLLCMSVRKICVFS